MCRLEDEESQVNREEYLEKILRPVHNDGKSLWITFVFVSSVGLLGALNIFSYQFIGKTPKNYWCQIDALSNTSWTDNQIKDIAIPKYKKNGIEEYSQCDNYQLDYVLLSTMSFDDAQKYVDNHPTNKTIKCSHRHFEGDIISFVTKWDLVCDRRSLYSTAQSAIQSGFIIDSFLFGYLSDKFGRRPLFLWCFGLCVLCGMLTAIVPYLWLFILLRIFISTFSLSAINTGIVLCLEICSVHRRSFIGACFSLPWALGIMILPLIAYYIRTWYYLQLAINVPFAFIFLITWCLGIVSESPRWLIMNKKYDEAYDSIKKIADFNNDELPYKELIIKDMKTATNQHETETPESLGRNVLNSLKTMCSFFVRTDLRMKTLLTYFIWCASSMVYYGVSLGADTINTNEYLYMFFSGLVEFCALLILWPVTTHFGRRYSLLYYFTSSAVSILIVAVLQYLLLQSKLEWLRFVLYLVGKFSISAAFQLVWVYTSELYPTNLRCLASGGGSSIAKVGSVFSPYINDILGQKIDWIPAATFGIFSLLSAGAVIFLPETGEETLQEDLPSPKIQKHEISYESGDIEQI